MSEHRAETAGALVVAYDALAYLSIVAALMSGGAPGAEYSGAWLHLQEFIAKAERRLAKIDPQAPLELRVRIIKNAASLQAKI